MRRRWLRLAAPLLAAILLGSIGASGVAAHGASGGSGGRWDLLRAAVATARFHSTAQASRAGYGGFPAGVPLHECISSFDNSGAMGFHWLNGGNLTTDLDPTRPQVLVYEPDGGGKLHLVALEFVVFKADWVAAHGDTTPSLFGEDFMDSGFPNRYDLPGVLRAPRVAVEVQPVRAVRAVQPERLLRRGIRERQPGPRGAERRRGRVACRRAAGFTCSMRRAASA